MTKPYALHDPRSAITVTAPARLHLGFLDLNGGLGRRFGSLGLAIDTFQTRVTLTQARGESAFGTARPPSVNAQERAQHYLDCLSDKLGVSRNWEVLVEESIPEHLGMGSGTQLSLAVGTALARLAGLRTQTRELAKILGRGSRSGVGIGAFDRGGFLMDSGRFAKSGPPPLTARLDFPRDWRVLLILDRRNQGLNGATELDAFHRLPVFPEEKAAHLCRIALMQVLPAIVEEDLTSFAKGIGEIQRTVGNHFAPAQGGRFTSPAVAEVLDWAESIGLEGIGQSSWGPTGFIFLPDAESAEEVRAQAQRRLVDQVSLQFQVVAACNRGHRASDATKTYGTLRSAHQNVST
ncbi:beta-ribofuranosylaminobenzene 5'-phosphate synthase family protein [Thioalkalivibrio sp.]|uniref:beta-ribofuranosylaminobenzene 5'-phosphate synthase family protein n=1 Tax=Thioalkalivibrio sp. TaxID=2093813 RepID=UPI0035695BCC